MKRRSPLMKLALGSSVLIAVFVILRMKGVDFSSVTVESFKEQIQRWGVWGPVIYIVFYLMRPLILFPAGVLSASAGAIWGTGEGLLIVLCAAYLSATVEFLIARYFARDAVRRLIRGRFQGIDQAIEKRGFLTVLLIRLIPNVAWDIQNLGLGVTRVRFKDYVLATAIGIVPGSFAFVFLGSSFISVVVDPNNAWKMIAAMGVLILVIAVQRRLSTKKITRKTS